MSMTRNFLLASCACIAAVFAPAGAFAQSTDGYHTIQVFPVVVDSASFTQRFTFRNPNATTAVSVAPVYYPGNGTSQPAPLGCPQFTVPANGQRVFTSLRQLCPALGGGSQFGFLYTSEDDGANLPYAAFSRVSNIAGNGFSVEAFPAHTFTSADVVVTGIRRLAATAGSPAYQTNCFIANLNELTPPPVPVTTTVKMYINNSAGVQVGTTALFPLLPGHLVRLLDVFSAAGAPAGDYNDARALFTENGTDEPGLMAFCTVQDNSSFGADFRIAKQERGFNSPFASVGAQDDHVSRSAGVKADVMTSGDLAPRPFSIDPGDQSNTHVMYFRHPDWVRCELIDPATALTATNSYGLEMRLLAGDGQTVLAGGSDMPGFGLVYLGDKTDRNNGANGRYTIEVESNGLNAAATRPYTLRCHSGSGQTSGDLLRWHEPVVRF